MSAGDRSLSIGRRNQETVEGGQRPVSSRDQHPEGSRDQHPEGSRYQRPEGSCGQRLVGSRNQRRAYNIQQTRALEDRIPFRELDLREAAQAGSGKPTVRSQNWKKKQQQKRDTEGRKPEQNDTATAPNDKLFCDMHYHTAHCVHKYDPDEPCYNDQCPAGGRSLNIGRRYQETVEGGQRPVGSRDQRPEGSRDQHPEGSRYQRPEDSCGQRLVGSRNQRRAYNIQQTRALEDRIPFRELDLREAAQAGSGKPTVRSQNWKKKQQQKRDTEGRKPEQNDTATAPNDKLFSDMHNHTAHCVHKYDPDEQCYNDQCPAGGCSLNIGRRYQETVEGGQRPVGSRDQRPEVSRDQRPEGSCGQRPEVSRDQHPAYNIQQMRAHVKGFPFMELLFEQRLAAQAGRRPEQRDTETIAFMNGQWVVMDRPFCGMQYHTSDCLLNSYPDDPCYNIGPHTALIPLREVPSHKSLIHDHCDDDLYSGIDSGNEIDW